MPDMWFNFCAKWQFESSCKSSSLEKEGSCMYGMWKGFLCQCNFGNAHGEIPHEERRPRKQERAED